MSCCTRYNTLASITVLCGFGMLFLTTSLNYLERPILKIMVDQQQSNESSPVLTTNNTEAVQEVTEKELALEPLTFDQTMKSRAAHLEEECKKYHQSGGGVGLMEELHPKKYFLERDKKFLWCPVYKASSSNWFHYLYNISPEHQVHT